MAARSAKKSASKKLDTETLIGLGAKRLAELILAQADEDPIFARSVRMALAAQEDPASLAHEIDKRLKTIRRSRGFIDWDKVRPLARELDQLRETITGMLADSSPPLAIEQLSLLLSLAESVYNRADDSSGALGDVFGQAGQDLGSLWCRQPPGRPADLGAKILELVESDGYGVYDELLTAASPALGREGRQALRELVVQRQCALSPGARQHDGYRTAWLLPKLADLDDDVDAYIATVGTDRSNSLINARVAERLLRHDRVAEALEWIDAPTDRGYNEREMDALRLQALDRLGRKDAAQTERRKLFERWLDAPMLRDWLKALSAFEDFEAEQQALDYALQHENANLALDFLIRWPDLARAGRLIRERLEQLESRIYSILRPAAEALSSVDPAAATVLYRRLVVGVLERGVSKYYPYAAQDFEAARMSDAERRHDTVPVDHDAWVTELRHSHGRKMGFWNLVARP